jgi:hypothetical protein
LLELVSSLLRPLINFRFTNPLRFGWFHVLYLQGLAAKGFHSKKYLIPEMPFPKFGA